MGWLEKRGGEREGSEGDEGLQDAGREGVGGCFWGKLEDCWWRGWAVGGCGDGGGRVAGRRVREEVRGRGWWIAV